MAQQTITVRSAAPDATGKMLGLAVFALGVALLIVVFVLGYRDLLLASEAMTFSRALALPVTLVYKGAVLLIMALVASAIANKGIALYQAAHSAPAE